ncbi:hypothetical protein BLA29_005347 [Euroglyphus maynei]|uniref:Uncharacterized protein n=1 Tax=Euroglyphus maynei TaxID=6958 RepID=A0A1Y3AZI4_EURMA|nr:hypothetical protein BLA29_005347 [Euroglyphus maynei]
MTNNRSIKQQQQQQPKMMMTNDATVVKEKTEIFVPGKGPLKSELFDDNDDDD